MPEQPVKSDAPKGKGRGKSKKGEGRGAGKGSQQAGGSANDVANELADLDDGSVQQSSKIEILRAERANARAQRGKKVIHDTVRENEGVDEADPENSFDDGIRLEPFNMRREMEEGHFDEGGHYILNKDDEKQVTDAWLDTVDHAQRSATFKKVDDLKKANAVAAKKMTSLFKNMGSEKLAEEDENQQEIKEDEEEVKEGGEEWPAGEAAPEEPEEDPATEIQLLEELITELMPLENPGQALKRWARGGVNDSKHSALKTRSRIKQMRFEADATQKGQATQGRPLDQQGGEKASKRSKFNEWGYEAPAAADSTAAAETAAAAPATTEAPAAKDSTAAAETAAAAPATTEAPAAAKSETPATAETTAQLAENVSSLAASDLDPEKAAAVAAAAAKAAATDKAQAEAAAAFAKEMKTMRQTVHMGLDGSGVEASAMLNSDDTSKAKIKALVPEVAEDGAPRLSETQQHRKRAAEPSKLENRKKIERLTELCDGLLQLGVNVYSSTREALAIQVRESRGELFGADDKKAEENTVTEADAGDRTATQDSATAASTAATSSTDAPKSSEVAAAPVVTFDNKRCTATEGLACSLEDLLAAREKDTSASALGDADKAGGHADTLLWQYRWTANPEGVYGPFDSTTMHGWATQGCFSEERPTEVRQCDAENKPTESCWHKCELIDFELYL